MNTGIKTSNKKKEIMKKIVEPSVKGIFTRVIKSGIIYKTYKEF